MTNRHVARCVADDVVNVRLPNPARVGPGYLEDFPGTAGSCANCHAPGAGIDGYLTTDMNDVRDTITAPAASSADNFLFTDSGNNKEFVAHGLVYAPEAQIEFGNVSNTATQRMLGGLISARLVLQSSTSATNFEIWVPTSPITARIELTSTAIKESETSVKAIVEYRKKHGPFRSADDLSLVKGIGERTVELNRADIRVRPVARK